MEGPRQVWTWSRVDGGVRQHRVTPAVDDDVWLEDHPNGWSEWPASLLCNTPEEAVHEAREHFRRVAAEAGRVLSRLPPAGARP